jgi:hypothetical protein
MKSIKISAAFLSAVLIAGTIAALFPSFMIGAQADPYYGMDKDRKSDKKDVSVQSLKCTNINVNVNGLELDVFPPFLGGGDIAAEAAEPSTDASSFAGSGDSDGGSVINDFRFICINNNNNTVIGGEEPIPPEPIPPTPPVDPCEDCFAQNLNATGFEAVEDELDFGIEIKLDGQLPQIVDSFAELCDLIEEHPNQIFFIIDVILDAADVTDPTAGSDIVECIAIALNIPLF